MIRGLYFAIVQFPTSRSSLWAIAKRIWFDSRMSSIQTKPLEKRLREAVDENPTERMINLGRVVYKDEYVHNATFIRLLMMSSTSVLIEDVLQKLWPFLEGDEILGQSNRGGQGQDRSWNLVRLGYWVRLMTSLSPSVHRWRSWYRRFVNGYDVPSWMSSSFCRLLWFVNLFCALLKWFAIDVYSRLTVCWK